MTRDLKNRLIYTLSVKKNQLLVEVQRKFSDYDIQFELHQKLYPLLSDNNFSLFIIYSTNLSKLAVDRLDRDIKNERFEVFYNELSKHLEFITHAQLPYSFDLDGSQIVVEETKPDRGRISFAKSFTLVPHEKYVEQIRESTYRKASKRNSWEGVFLELPFLIFLDLETTELDEAVFPALYGSKNYIEWLEANEIGPQRVFYPKFVVDKFQGVHQELLFKLGFDSRRRFHIDQIGIFLTEENVKKNATGVVAMFSDEVECFPNPFCDEKICIYDLAEFLDIPLTSCAVGGSG